MATESLHDEAQYRVLRVLETDPTMSQRALARELGISLGKTNYCIKALLSKGLLKVQNFRNSQNKCVYAYLLTPAGLAAKAELTAEFLKRKVVEYEMLRDEINRLRKEAGQEDKCRL